MSSSDSLAMLAILVGAVTGGALFLLVIALRGLPSRPKKQGPGALERRVADRFTSPWAAALWPPFAPRPPVVASPSARPAHHAPQRR